MRWIFAALTAVTIAIIASFVSVPILAQTTALWPKATVVATTNGAAAVLIGSNPTRRSIRICNVGSNAVWIWPGPLTPTTSDFILAPVAANVATCYTPPSGIITSAGNSWNAGIGLATSLSIEEW